MEQLKEISQKAQMRPFGADFSQKVPRRCFQVSFTKMYYELGPAT